MSDAAVPPRQLAHFVLRTRRYAELIDWYRTVLGAKPVFESPFITFLTWDAEHHRLAIANAPHYKDRPDDCVGFDHIAVTLPSAVDLLRTYERLRDLGIRPTTPIHHGPSLSLHPQGWCGVLGPPEHFGCVRLRRGTTLHGRDHGGYRPAEACA